MAVVYVKDSLIPTSDVLLNEENPWVQPNIVRDDGIVNSYETLSGTSHEVDYFVFDLSDTNDGSGNRAFIVSFEEGFDKVAFTNYNPDEFYNPFITSFSQDLDGIQNDTFIQVHDGAGRFAVAYVKDSIIPTTDVLTYTGDPFFSV